MPNLEPTQADATIQEAFLGAEKGVRIQNYRVACILAAVFMPLGISLDWLVYPEHTPFFFALRLLCSALLLFIWWLVKTPLGTRYYRVLGMILPALPTFFISWMIYWTDGILSTYYAGLNLVLLGAAIVLRWTLRDSLNVFFIVLVIYAGACGLHFFHDRAANELHLDTLWNNLYFLSVTGAFVVIGSHFYNRLRFQEFSLRFQLDQNKKALEASNEKLVELDQVKSRFFANISHELRTPLTLLLAPLESLINRFQKSLDSQARELLVTMHSNGMRLLKLINDLLDLVRLESGVIQVKREAVDIRDFIKGLASSAKQMADDKRIRFETAVDDDVGLVMIDRDKMEKVILNLQFNALKFTPSGGRIEIRAKRVQEELVVSVQDTGMGISAKQLPRVFDRFWQADGSSKRKYQGVGIGLALVKELVEAHDGRVDVVSEEGVGSTFTVHLPYLEGKAASAGEPSAEPSAEAAPGPAVAQEAGTVSSQEWLSDLYRRAELFPSMQTVQDSVRPVETARNGTHPKLLVADDEPDMLRFIKSQLRDHYQVLEAVDGQQAIDKAAQFLPDIILLDMMMPEKDGLQACKEIRQRTSTHNIPIILLTARADEETKMSALEAGASDFLPKPFSTTELHVRIKNLVESFQYQRKLSKQNNVLESTIEQLKDTETQLVQTEKLASLGRLSAGIIHEINNPLNFATTGLFTLRKIGNNLDGKDREEYQEILKDVEEGINRVKTIVSDLRSFSHHDDQQVEDVWVEEVVTSALRFLSHEWKDKVRVEQNIADGLVFPGNKNKIIQVLVNLLQNAMDAMKAKTYTDDGPTLWLEGVEAGPHCRLIVRDNGSGIKPEDMDKIFDPFFTTKDVGEGMGLGLSICYRIVRDHEGEMAVKSDYGKNCEFTLEFPMKEALAHHAQAAGT